MERYFSTFLDHINDAGGDIYETAGDSFMAIFQDPDVQTHAMKAVDAALAIVRATVGLNEKSPEQLAIHIGVSSGLALVGATRFEGLRGSRWTFTASGPVTNLAARLAGAAGTNQVLAGPETVRRLEDRYRLERIGRERLKNIAEPVELLRVVGLASET